MQDVLSYLSHYEADNKKEIGSKAVELPISLLVSSPNNAS
jgi:hypothetical protein